MPLSAFHPVVRRWFAERLGGPTAPQREGWPLIASGRHTLIAAPTGTGKTLAAFLWALDRLLRQGTNLKDATQVLHVTLWHRTIPRGRLVRKTPHEIPKCHIAGGRMEW